MSYSLILLSFATTLYSFVVYSFFFYPLNFEKEETAFITSSCMLQLREGQRMYSGKLLFSGF